MTARVEEDISVIMTEGIIESIGHHALLLVFVQVFLLLVVARTLGELAVLASI